MHNVIKLIRQPQREKLPQPDHRTIQTARIQGAQKRDFGDIAFRHGFEAYAVLDIDSRNNGVIEPAMGPNTLGDEVLGRIALAGELSRCSVFLMLAETSLPFSFTTGLDCRTNAPSDPSLSDNALDAVLNDYGMHGGYCVPVASPDAHRSVVMYFSRRFERFDARYPELVLETMEYFESHWYQIRTAEQPNEFKLSAQESVCLQKLGDGHSLGDIGADLRVSDHAVAIYINSAMKKLKTATVAQAVLEAWKKGVL
jgi:DNA-binding CsgD family transcriptional regulator